MNATTFASDLLTWFDRHGRHDLPWQHPRTPYRVWVSEIMLQQTQVQSVLNYFVPFIATFPDVPSLAAAQEGEVLSLWAGLGYYGRARNLHRAAQRMVERHGGEVPDTFETLQALPGIGRSTAGAILAQAFGQRHAILDGNVRRVLCRYHGIEGWPGQRAIEQHLWTLAEQHTPHERLCDYTQAMMDLGATLCTRRRPQCLLCPLVDGCAARQAGTQETLPTPRPRKTLPEHTTRMLLLWHRGHILLQQRQGNGVWQGLWSLPECPIDIDPSAYCTQKLGVRVQRQLPRAPFVHTFSHYRLRIEPWQLDVDPSGVGEHVDLNWFAPEALPAVPAPIRRLVEQPPSGDPL